jgi:hypothetical protein
MPVSPLGEAGIVLTRRGSRGAVVRNALHFSRETADDRRRLRALVKSL